MFPMHRGRACSGGYVAASPTRSLGPRAQGMDEEVEGGRGGGEGEYEEKDKKQDETRRLRTNNIC